MRVVCLSLPLALIACSGGGGKGTDTATEGGTERTRDYFVNTTTPYVADSECVGAAPPSVDATKQVVQALVGKIEDFQTEEPVEEAFVDFWSNDDIMTAADISTEADKTGAFAAEVPVCSPIAYGTSTPPDWEQTVDTYQVHVVYGHGGDDGTIEETVNSVSEATATIIPAIIGIEWERDKAIVAGRAYDCETGVEGENEVVANAQVFLHDGAGTPPATGEIFYFDSSDLPTTHENQPHANAENGLWVAVNVPVGAWTVDLYGWDGADYVVLGSTSLQIKAGSVNISSIYAGTSDGTYYPPSCLSQ